MKWNLECLKATSSKKKPRNRYYKCFQNLYVNGLLIKKKKKKKSYHYSTENSINKYDIRNLNRCDSFTKM